MKTIFVLLLLSMIVCSQTKPDRSPAKSPGAGKSYQSGEANRNKSINNNFHKTQLQTLDTSKVKSAENEFENLLSMSKQAYQKDDIAKSITYLRQALALIAVDNTMVKARLEVERKLAKYLDIHALKLIEVGKYSEAEPLLKENLDIIRHIHQDRDNKDVALCINNLAWIYKRTGKFKESGQLYREALEMKRRIYYDRDDSELATGIQNMATYLHEQEESTEAESLFIEGLNMMRRIYKNRDHKDLACSINNMAAYLTDIGHYLEAEKFHMEALEMRRRLFKNQDHLDLIISISNYAYFLSLIGRNEEAEDLFSEAIRISRRIYKNQEDPEFVTIINNSGWNYYTQNKYSEAKVLLKEALDMFRKLYQNNDHDNLAVSINNYALSLYYSDDQSEAKTYFEEAIEMFRRLYKNKDHPNLAVVINTQAILLKNEGNYKESEELFRESLQMFERIYNEKDHPQLSLSIDNLACLLYELNRNSEAIELFLSLNEMNKRLVKRYLYSLTEKQKESFLSTYTNYIEKFNSISINLSKQNNSFLTSMYSNQLFFKGIIGQSSANLRHKIDKIGDEDIISLYKRWIQQLELLSSMSVLTSEQLREKGVNLQNLEKEANDLEKELNSKVADMFEERNSLDITWKDIQTKIEDQEAAIEVIRFRYYDKSNLTDSVMYAALVVTKETKAHPELVLLENGNELEGSLLKEYQDYIATSQYQEKGEELSDDSKLYNAFWGKIAEKIKRKTRVYLSSDGVYNQINLNSLYNPKTKKYVIDEIEIVLLTNTRELAMKKKERKYENTAELFGFPNYDLGADQQKEIAQDYDLKRKRLLEGVRLTELPGTRIEIEESGNILQKNKWVVNEYLGDNALEENLKKTNSPRLLHIATHGAFLEEEDMKREREYTMGFIGENQQVYYDNPLLRSALFFSGANRSRKGINVEGVEDGVFTGYEAQNLNLMNTELVILSACETGLGVIKSGEGVYGLQRAFRVAGAENIIMSLWKVSDEATKDLILSFYAKWTGGRSVKEAFRESQRELRDKYPGAYYWAAFVLISG